MTETIELKIGDNVSWYNTFIQARVYGRIYDFRESANSSSSPMAQVWTATEFKWISVDELRKSG